MPADCKFLAFTDLHYYPGVFLPDAQARLERILERAEREQVDFVAFTGDSIHIPEHKFLSERFFSTGLPVKCALGNHDTDAMTLAEAMELYRLDENYYSFDASGYRFLMLDANYFPLDGEFVHYEPGKKRTDAHGFLPDFELEWIRATIDSSPYPCVLLSHQSIERTDGITNRDALWTIISAANRKRSRSVIMYINGHYHCDFCTIVNDVCCLDLNSASYHWTDPTNSYYPPEMYEKISILNHIIGYDRPLSAIIELEGIGKIRVRGQYGEFMYSPDGDEIKRLDSRRVSESRIVVPYIRDREIDLDSGYLRSTPAEPQTHC